MKAKADALGMLPLMVSTVDDQVLESGPLVDLAERPNPMMTGRQFRRHTSAYLDLFGRVHWCGLPPETCSSLYESRNCPGLGQGGSL